MLSKSLYLLFKKPPNSMWYSSFSFPAQPFVFLRADNYLLFLLVYLSMYLSLIWFQRLWQFPVSSLKAFTCLRDSIQFIILNGPTHVFWPGPSEWQPSARPPAPLGPLSPPRDTLPLAPGSVPVFSVFLLLWFTTLFWQSTSCHNF